ncbi:hypothetical protein DL93DRAFT_1094683 [Clavulina sp. PMI_390]|nr:hypothetical protein DL93DRAFT_1094683 [Clavulina sp. PMI_390]
MPIVVKRCSIMKIAGRSSLLMKEFHRPTFIPTRLIIVGENPLASSIHAYRMKYRSISFFQLPPPHQDPERGQNVIQDNHNSGVMASIPPLGDMTRTPPNLRRPKHGSPDSALSRRDPNLRVPSLHLLRFHRFVHFNL